MEFYKNRDFKKYVLKRLDTKNVDQITRELRDDIEMILTGYVCGDRLSKSNRIIRI